MLGDGAGRQPILLGEHAGRSRIGYLNIEAAFPAGPLERLVDQFFGMGRTLGTVKKRDVLLDKVEELSLIVVDLGPSIDSSCLRTFSDSSSKRLVPNQRSR